MSAPTDLELMMLLDGELEEGRRAEVEAFLAEADGAEGRGKLAGMRSVSAVVQTFEWPAHVGVAAGDVADLVMAELVTGGVGEPAPNPAGDASTATAPLSRDGASRDEASPRAGAGAREAAGSSRSAPPREAAPTAPRKVASETPLPVSARTPANDNSRAIFGIAIAAAAAAAALFLWGKTGDDAGRDGTEPVAMTAPSGSPSGERSSGDRPSPGAPEPLPELLGVAPEPAGDADEPRYGVEVATVDFGARSGAIYYVPGDLEGAEKAAVTTVVWLNDD